MKIIFKQRGLRYTERVVSFPPMRGTITGERSFRYRFGTNQIHKTPNERDASDSCLENAPRRVEARTL